MPGTMARMQPRPDHGEVSYKASGCLAGKKAIITGGDSGIGRAVAIGYAREGADILVSYLDATTDAEEVKALIEAEGRKAILVAGNLQDAEMTYGKPTDDPRKRSDSGSLRQTDTPWKQPEKEQGGGAKKSDVDKWNDTNTH